MGFNLLNRRKFALMVLTIFLLLGIGSAFAYRFRPQASEVIPEETSCTFYKLLGQLTDKKGPLANRSIKLINSDSEEEVTDTDAAGDYEFASVTPGDYTLNATHPDTGALLTSKVTILDMDLRVDLTFPAETTGRTLGGTLYEFNSQTNILEQSKKTTRVTLFAEDGKTELRSVSVATPGYSLKIDDLQDGFYWLQAKSSNGTSNFVGLEVNQNYKIFNRNLSINWPSAKKEFLVKGTVSYISGKPVDSGRIVLSYPETSSSFKDGHYKLYSVFAGEYTIQAIDGANRASNVNQTLKLDKNDPRLVIEHNLVIDDTEEQVSRRDHDQPKTAVFRFGRAPSALAQSTTKKCKPSHGITVTIEGSSWQWSDPPGDETRKFKDLVETPRHEVPATVALFEEGRSDRMCKSTPKDGKHFFDNATCSGQLSISPSKRYTVFISGVNRKYYFKEDLQGSGTLTSNNVQPGKPYTSVIFHGHIPVVAGEMFHQNSNSIYNNDAPTIGPPYRLCQKYGTVTESKKRACDNTIDIAAYYLYELDASKLRAQRYAINLSPNSSKKEKRPILAWRSSRQDGWHSNPKQWGATYLKSTLPNRIDLLTEKGDDCLSNDKKACIQSLVKSKNLAYFTGAGCDPESDINRYSKTNRIISDEVLDAIITAGKAAKAAKFTVTINCITTGHRKYIGRPTEEGNPKCGEADPRRTPPYQPGQLSQHCIGKAVDFKYLKVPAKVNNYLKTIPGTILESKNHWHLEYE